MPDIKTAIGLMSGTSMDGIDLAVVQTDGHSIFKHGQFPTAVLPYSQEDRLLVEQVLLSVETSIKDRADRTPLMTEVEERLTRLNAKLVLSFLEENQADLPSIDMIGFHGQTVFHKPDAGITIQLGNGQLLSDLTGLPVVYDMRANDMQYGGQGAPLVPIYHEALSKNLSLNVLGEKASDAGASIAFVNIGGISNITYVGQELIAFDSGPGNALIDQWVERHLGIPFDQGGTIASEGQIERELIDGYLDHSFFTQPFPKSLDRSDFALPPDNPVSIESGARSFARLTAEAIFKSALQLPDMPKIWIVCGGGAHNPYIMNDLRELAEYNSSTILAAEEVGMAGDFVEAEAWAFLAVRSSLGLPITFPKTTGCSMPVSGGTYVVPSETKHSK